MRRMIPVKLSNKLVVAIKHAEKGIYKDIGTKSISGEENITSALLREIRSSCSRVIENDLDIYGPYEIWSRDFPKRSMESVVGADFAITIRKFKEKKKVTIQTGVKTALVQAKLPTNDDYNKLEEQINDMNDFADESYVAVHDEKGIYVSASKDVRNAKCRVIDIPNDKKQSLDDFFKDIFACEKGEWGFDSKNIQPLNDIFYFAPVINSVRSLEFVVIEDEEGFKRVGVYTSV